MQNDRVLLTEERAELTQLLEQVKAREAAAAELERVASEERRQAEVATASARDRAEAAETTEQRLQQALRDALEETAMARLETQRASDAREVASAVEAEAVEAKRRAAETEREVGARCDDALARLETMTQRATQAERTAKESSNKLSELEDALRRRDTELRTSQAMAEGAASAATAATAALQAERENQRQNEQEYQQMREDWRLVSAMGTLSAAFGAMARLGERLGQCEKQDGTRQGELEKTVQGSTTLQRENEELRKQCDETARQLEVALQQLEEKQANDDVPDAAQTEPRGAVVSSPNTTGEQASEVVRERDALQQERAALRRQVGDLRHHWELAERRVKDLASELSDLRLDKGEDATSLAKEMADLRGQVTMTEANASIEIAELRREGRQAAETAAAENDKLREELRRAKQSGSAASSPVKKGLPAEVESAMAALGVARRDAILAAEELEATGSKGGQSLKLAASLREMLREVQTAKGSAREGHISAIVGVVGTLHAVLHEQEVSFQQLSLRFKLEATARQHAEAMVAQQLQQTDATVC